MESGKNVIGAKVRNLRSSKDWSQEDLAARCQVAGWDISRATLSKIEAGLRRVTDAEVYFLASVLKVPIAKLFPSEEEVWKQLRQ